MTTSALKEQKIKMMQFAASDPDYLERCNTIQKEFEAIEFNWEKNGETIVSSIQEAVKFQLDLQ